MDLTLLDSASLREITQLIVAGALAGIIGYHREKHSRSAGLRTFPLVAIASCSYILLGQFMANGDPNAQARVLQGLMTGMGFIGGGAILKNGNSVSGTATAASIWNTGALGAAVGYHRYDFAIVLTLLNAIILFAITPLKDAPDV
jgi:putative Mg2+ transporter-C (MgtC) family protein